MPKSRKRHHSRSRSRSRSHSRDRDEKYKKNDYDRDGKRRKIDSFDSPHHKRSVSSEEEHPESENSSSESFENEVESQLTSSNEENKSSFDVDSEKADVSTNEEVIEISEDEDYKTSLPPSDGEDLNSSLSLAKAEPLEVTPKKISSPRQAQKNLDSNKKRMERQKEKEEKERLKNEEKERIKQEKLKKKEQKQREMEMKQKEKLLKEEQRKKEREEKEEQKRKEREEKEQKRKEREEKEEQKRREREQEKLKKQQEIEEKNKEKQREEEKKQKAAAAFVNFFVSKKPEVTHDDKKTEDMNSSIFMAFEVKSDMKLPPFRRPILTPDETEIVDKYLSNQDENASYLKDLKSGKSIGKSAKTWPYEETVDNDVTIIEEDDLGETVHEDKLQKFRAKFMKFHENRRPPYFGTWRKKSRFVTPRKPFAEDNYQMNYEEDSDDDWEEEEQGESLNGSEDEADKENEEKDDYEVDNEFFVPHGHLSDDEVDDEEKSKLSPESLKQKLSLLKDEFEQDMSSKIHKLKPRYIGCIWYNKNGNNVEDVIDRYLKPLSMITNGQIEIKKRDPSQFGNTRKVKPLKELDPEHVPVFLKVIHGNTNRKKILIEQFITYMTNNGFTMDVAKTELIRNLKRFASWKKCTDRGPMRNKLCWCVNDDLVKKYNIVLESDK